MQDIEFTVQIISCFCFKLNGKRTAEAAIKLLLIWFHERKINTNTINKSRTKV